MSDITTTNGKVLDERFLTRKEMSVHKNQFRWPEKHSMVSKDYTIWKSLLKIIYTFGNYELYVLLGKWYEKMGLTAGIGLYQIHLNFYLNNIKMVHGTVT